MEVAKEQVFLVQGQTVTAGVVDGAVTQRVVVAASELRLQEFLSENGHSFHPAGWASLKQYEDAISQIREALNGQGNLKVELAS